MEGAESGEQGPGGVVIVAVMDVNPIPPGPGLPSPFSSMVCDGPCSAPRRSAGAYIGNASHAAVTTMTDSSSRAIRILPAHFTVETFAGDQGAFCFQVPCI